jgi:Protein of unknown function (DUF3592)
MTDAVVIRPAPQMKASGLAGLVGLFAGLCAVLIAFVTLSEWVFEARQAYWPAASAMIDRVDVVNVRAAPRELWKLDVRLHYATGGETRRATLSSRVVTSEEATAELQAWVNQVWVEHGKGGPIEIRYDPSRPFAAILASPAPDFSPPSRTRSNLILFAIAAILSAGLMALARFLMRREAHMPPVMNDGQQSSLLLGAVFAAPGLITGALVIHRAGQEVSFGSEGLIAVLISLMFTVAGVLIALPAGWTRSRGLLGAIAVTCLALTFDLVAFGPGERHFTGSFNGNGFIPSETMGRVVFGITALVMDACAIAMWVGQYRQLRWSKPPTS